MDAARPRYRPEDPWPAYAYLPGRDPHPLLHPDGHSHGTPEPDPSPVDPRRWRESADYLRGADLYNHGYHWEAHECWEALWNRPFEDEQREFLQGLIQAAAAAVQQRLDHDRGRARLAHRAATRLRRVHARRGDRYMGVHLWHTATAWDEWAFGGGPPPVLWLRT